MKCKKLKPRAYKKMLREKCAYMRNKKTADTCLAADEYSVKHDAFSASMPKEKTADTFFAGNANSVTLDAFRVLDNSEPNPLTCKRDELSATSFVTLSNMVPLVEQTDTLDQNIDESVDDISIADDSNRTENIHDEELNVAIAEKNDDFQKISGRRLIDINYFLNELQNNARHNGLFDCRTENFKLVGEKRLGLISKFKFECNMCHEIIVIQSENSTSADQVNANIAATSGIIASGIGYSQFHEIFSAMNVPIFSTNYYAQLQDQVYEKWEMVAAESMEIAALREKEAAIAEGRTKNGIPLIDVYVDGCWSARSYGTNYKALSGAAAIIGKKYGEVLFMGVKNKYCLVCARAEKNNNTPKDHICFKNYSGSSSSMESDIILEGFRSSVTMYGIIYTRLIADGDSATYAKILKANPYKDHNVTVEKIECRNHILRNLCKKLRNITKETKYALSHRKTLTNTKIMSMRKAIVKSVQYHNKVTDKPKTASVPLLHKDIANSLAHAYGDHRMCQEHYCDKQQNEKNDFQCVQNSTFFFRINAIISTVAAKSRSLIENVDTNTVERFNSVVAKFVGGKRINFTQRRGYQGRCAAAIVSFNDESSLSKLQKAFLNKSPRGKVKELEQKRSLKRKLNMNHPTKKNRRICDKISQHDYGPNSSAPDLTSFEMERAKKDFIDNLKVLVNDRDRIERSTILQADSSDWLEIRSKMITASVFGSICKRKPSLDTSPLVKNILYKKNISHVKAVSHGVENEKHALQQMQQQESLTIEPCGLFIDEIFPFIGATPDGLVGTDTVVEIKCPITAHKEGLQNAIKQNKIQILHYDKKTGTSKLKTSSNWYYQVQGQLRVTGRKKCLFGIWSGEKEPIHILEITRDDKFWQEKMEPKLVQFYMTCLLPELIDPRQTRGMDLRKIMMQEEEGNKLL